MSHVDGELNPLGYQRSKSTALDDTSNAQGSLPCNVSFVVSDMRCGCANIIQKARSAGTRNGGTRNGGTRNEGTRSNDPGGCEGVKERQPGGMFISTGVDRCEC